MSRRRPFSARPKKGRDALEGGELGWVPEVEPKGMKGSELVPPEASFFFYLIILFIYLFIWLCWVFVSVRGLSLAAASWGHSSSRCAGLSLPRPLLWRSTGSRRAGSVIVAHGPSCSAACGIFPDQGSNHVPCIGRRILNHCVTREAPPEASEGEKEWRRAWGAGGGRRVLGVVTGGGRGVVLSSAPPGVWVPVSRCTQPPGQ